MKIGFEQSLCVAFGTIMFALQADMMIDGATIPSIAAMGAAALFFGMNLPSFWQKSKEST